MINYNKEDLEKVWKSFVGDPNKYVDEAKRLKEETEKIIDAIETAITMLKNPEINPNLIHIPEDKRTDVTRTTLEGMITNLKKRLTKIENIIAVAERVVEIKSFE